MFNNDSMYVYIYILFNIVQLFNIYITSITYKYLKIVSIIISKCIIHYWKILCEMCTHNIMCTHITFLCVHIMLWEHILHGIL